MQFVTKNGVFHIDVTIEILLFLSEICHRFIDYLIYNFILNNLVYLK
jgi:hypothetical protein